MWPPVAGNRAVSELCRLYLITPPSIESPAAFVEQFKSALDGGDIASIQVRLKGADGAAAPHDDVLRLCEALTPAARDAGVAIIVNDDPNTAKSADADGVHIGQSDASYAEARKILGDDKIIGVTCHNSTHLAMEAGEAGADYVAFGAFFPTVTKTAPTTASLEILSDWAFATTVPCVAIGGITPDNCGPVIQAGADLIAVSAGVWRHPDGPRAGVAKFNQAFAEFS